MKMEPSFCTAVFWRGGEKIDLNGQKPDAVRCLSVTGERKVNLSFLRDYPNLEELTLMEKCEGVEAVSYTHLDVYKRQPLNRTGEQILTDEEKSNSYLEKLQK